MVDKHTLNVAHGLIISKRERIINIMEWKGNVHKGSAEKKKMSKKGNIKPAAKHLNQWVEKCCMSMYRVEYSRIIYPMKKRRK